MRWLRRSWKVIELWGGWVGRVVHGVVGLDWVGLGWVGLEGSWKVREAWDGWIGLDWVGLDWTGLGWKGPERS